MSNRYFGIIRFYDEVVFVDLDEYPEQWENCYTIVDENGKWRTGGRPDPDHIKSFLGEDQ